MLQRYYGWYANRTRGIRRRAGAHEQPPAVEAESVPLSLPEARRRWAELLRRIFEVDPLRCSRCGHDMRIVAFITQPRVIDRILTTCGAPRRSPAARARRRGAGLLPAPPPRRKPFATIPRSLGSGAAGVRTCRLMAWPCLIPAARSARGR